MTKLEIAKKAASFVVGSGTGTITGQIIRNNVQPTNIYQRVTVVCAGVVIGSMASRATRDYTEQQIDELAAVVNDMRSNN